MARQGPNSTELTVVRTERLSDHLMRVYFGGPGFDRFEPSVFTDSYVKIELDSAGETVLRTYTIRSVDPTQREIAVDFVVHGDQGVAGPWAMSARPGDTVVVRGPGGAYRPDPDADWHLLAGDETAIPAIAAALESLPSDAIGRVFIEVAGADDEIVLTAPGGVEITWLYRGTDAGSAGADRVGANAPLVAAVTGTQWLQGTAHVFVHGEAETVMHHLRPYIRKERGVPAARASISGYWKRGRTEETFREWKRELAVSDAG
ncbi:MAG: siderophore-interacting protein [Rhodococcus sp. (in: high G+C Gram-positive bacteria)]|uniref:siderophore-interacting protein n=1 Tax=Rhodococcus sp. TaxID=1831 RepID=UPI003BB72BA3